MTKQFTQSRHRLMPITLSLCFGLLGLQFCAPNVASARRAQSASSQVVDVSLRKLGDKIEITVEGSAALNEPNWKWTGSPKRLRLSFKNTKLAYKAARMPLDVGVLQWIETIEDGGNLYIDLAASSAPKNSADINNSKTTLHWTISCNEMSSSEALPKLSQGVESAPKAAASKPPKIQPQIKPTVAKTPATVASAKPSPQPKSTPEPASTPKAAAPPVVPPVATKPPVNNTPAPVKTPAANPPSAKPADKIMTFTANGSLKQVLETLAQNAGLKAEIDPAVDGSVTQGYKDMPLNRIVSSILGQQPVLYEYKLTDTTLTVSAPSGGTGGVSVVTPQSGVGNRILKSEYFPIRDKRAVDLMEVVRKAVPGPSYTLDERLNQILVEGEPAEIERVRKLLQAVGSK